MKHRFVPLFVVAFLAGFPTAGAMIWMGIDLILVSARLRAERVAVGVPAQPRRAGSPLTAARYAVA